MNCNFTLDYTNPVYSEYFADPFVWSVNGVFYAVGTGPSAPAGHTGPSKFPVLRSRNLVDWSFIGHALIPPGPEYGTAYWAPEVAYQDGYFYMYYSVGYGDKRHQLRAAVSTDPAGPYEDLGALMEEPDSCPFAIDAHPFQDDDGQWYLFYARDFLDSGGGVRAGTGIVVDRLLNMTRLAGEEKVVVRASRDWQRFKTGRPMYGDIYDWHTLEGPVVRIHEGRYYCFYSGGCWQNETYGVDYVTAGNVMGPYTDSSREDGPRVLRTVPGSVIGPGHNSFVTGPDGKTLWIVYHAWDKAMTARRMCIDRFCWSDQGPSVISG